MRKLGSEKTEQEKRKRNVTIIGLLLLGVMVLSTIGYAITTSQRETDNGTPTNSQGLQQLDNGMWQVNHNGRILYFQNSPESLKNISISTSATLSLYAGKMLYIDSTNTAITSALASALSPYALRVQEGCYGTCERDLPEKNCTDNLIVWRDDPQNKISQTENCVFIDGDMRAIEAFLYRLLGY